MKKFVLFWIIFFIVAFLGMIGLMFYYGFNDDTGHAVMCSSSASYLAVSLFILIEKYKDL